MPLSEHTEHTEPINTTRLETVLDRPRRIEHIVDMDGDVSIDDLPAAPAGVAPRDARRELREVVDLLRSRLRAVEAQVVSLARELAARGRAAEDDDRARALITSSIGEVRAGLQAIDRCELRLGIERRPRPATPIPAV